MSTDARSSPLVSASERRHMLREALAVLTSSHAATVCGALQNMVVLAVISPRLMGIWTTVRTLLEYGSYSSLGASRAAGLEIAISAGRNDRRGVWDVANLAMTVELVTAGLVAVLLLCGGSAAAMDRNWNWSAAFGAGAALAVLSRYYTFSLSVLRSLKSFGTLARSRIFGAAVELLLFSAGAYFLGFGGLLGAAILAQAFGVLYVRRDGGLRFAPAFDRATMFSLMATGGPMAIEALALSALRSVDRFVIVRSLENGEEQLGWYKLAIVMGAWAFDQSNLVANVVFPRLGEALGRTNDPATVMRLGLRAAEVIALAMAPCTAALLVMGVPLADRFLHSYRPGLGAAGGLVSAAALLGICMPLRHALLTVRRIRSMLTVTVLSAFVSLGGAGLLLWGSNDTTGSHLASVAWTSAAAAAVLLTSTLTITAFRHRTLWGQAIRVGLIASYVVSGGVMFPTMHHNLVVAMLASAIWCAAPLWLLTRQVNWRGLILHP